MRILLLVSDATALSSVRERVSTRLAGQHALAICCVAAERASFLDCLETQQKITTVLRLALGSIAESVPIFVITGVVGDRVDDCAREWRADRIDS